MKTLSLILALCSGWASAGAFPYPVKKKTLPNGLDILVIEMPEFKDVLSYNTMVLAGSGKEEQRGATGLAHLFEHILFTHRFKGKDGGYNDAINRMGADNNAWTWFDITYYHPLTFTSNLAGLALLESSRFKALSINEKIFQTETGAVLGEYRKVASNPSMKMEERVYDLLYPNHPYGHTTMGYYDDVIDMPKHYEAAKKFYDTYYRPNGVVVVVAGDVKAEEVFKTLGPLYSDWKAQPIPPVKEKGPEPSGDRRERVAWDSDIAPQAWVAYRMPAFKLGSPEAGAAELLDELLISPAAPLQKKLRYEKQTASGIGFDEGTNGFESAEPRAIIVSAELFKEKLAAKGDAYFDDAIKDIEDGLDALKSFSKSPGAADLLKVIQSKYRYDFLSGLSSPRNVANVMAQYYRFNRDPQALDQLLDSVQKLKPEDIDRLAQNYFRPENRVVLTLAFEPSAKKGK
ncbi:MAG: insulinase family protein [Elusimicrobia bacterium]|nr:insulinase family protein [Elusimicrobiota bacterium]